jgi:hypothetical protein
MGILAHVWGTAVRVTEHDSTYMIFMLDLNIPDSDVTTSASYGSLIPGLAVNTTTRLVGWQQYHWKA